MPRGEIGVAERIFWGAEALSCFGRDNQARKDFFFSLSLSGRMVDKLWPLWFPQSFFNKDEERKKCSIFRSDLIFFAFLQRRRRRRAMMAMKRSGVEIFIWWWWRERENGVVDRGMGIFLSERERGGKWLMSNLLMRERDEAKKYKISHSSTRSESEILSPDVGNVRKKWTQISTQLYEKKREIIDTGWCSDLPPFLLSTERNVCRILWVSFFSSSSSSSSSFSSCLSVLYSLPNSTNCCGLEGGDYQSSKGGGTGEGRQKHHHYFRSEKETLPFPPPQKRWSSYRQKKEFFFVSPFARFFLLLSLSNVDRWSRLGKLGYKIG